MITRACFFGMIALASAIFGFGDMLDASAKFMQALACVALALSAISFLFGLFEEDRPVTVESEGDGLESVRSQGS